MLGHYGRFNDGPQRNTAQKGFFSILQPRYRRLNTVRPEALRPCLSTGLPSSQRNYEKQTLKSTANRELCNMCLLLPTEVV